MNRFRVVKLRSIGSKQFASGYLVRDNLVLTARHIFELKDDKGIGTGRYTDDKKCSICFLEDAEELKKIGWNDSACELVWFHPGYDMALLRLNCEIPKSLMNRVNCFTVSDFGKLDRDNNETNGKGVGFACYENSPNKLYSKQINLEGKLNRIDESGLLELYPSSVPKNPTDWQGISGTALFANDYLVGVITKTDGFWGEKALNANAISFVYEDKDFCDLIFTDENRPPLRSIKEILTNNKSISYGSKDLDKLLLDLNYGDQQKQIVDSMKTEKVKVFLLPPNGQYAQQWLVARLLRKITNYEIGNKYEFWANGTWNSNLGPFWFSWESKLSKVKSVEGQDVVLSLLGKDCKPQQPLIIIIHNIQKLKPETLTQVLTNFWERLIALEITGRCVLFLTQQPGAPIDIDSPLLIKIDDWQKVSSQEMFAWVECRTVADFLVNCSRNMFDSNTLLPLFFPNEPDEFLQELWGLCDLDINSHFQNNQIYNERSKTNGL
jgi:inactive STAND